MGNNRFCLFCFGQTLLDSWVVIKRNQNGFKEEQHEWSGDKKQPTMNWVWLILIGEEWT